MTWLEMGDSSSPPPEPTRLPAYGFYIGGETPHVWTDAELEALDSRWVLPIFTNINPGADAAAHADFIISWLHGHGWKLREVVAVDTEATEMAGYLAELDSRLYSAGFDLIDYESKSPEAGNPITHGGRWIADWTRIPHLFPGSVATQYASATMTGDPWDHSVISAGVRLHELHPPVVHRIPLVAVEADLPQLGQGDTGPAVRRLQSLISDWHPTVLGPAGVDGIFGPDTATAIRVFQRMFGITGAQGTADAETWERLLTG